MRDANGRSSVGRTDDLDELHQRHGIEEMHAEHPLSTAVQPRAMAATDREEVLVASTASGAARSSAANSCLFRLEHSIMASMTT